MKFGVREICEVVLKAKATQRVGNKTFYKGEPVIKFDTLKTSSMEGAATTVYAQGGRGNARLIAWEGERTVTFTMEDALISPEGLMILSGAGLIDASAKEKINVHMSEHTDKVFIAGASAGAATAAYVVVDAKGDNPYKNALSKDPNASIYVMGVKDGEIITEPYIGSLIPSSPEHSETVDQVVGDNESTDKQTEITEAITSHKDFVVKIVANTPAGYANIDYEALSKCDSVMVDYYTEKTSGAQQIEIDAEHFGGNYYLEASTLFRNEQGQDLPAEFIIPNCKIQSNFTFSMASSGDPSTFTFTMDAFPDYTRFNKTKKVFAAIQVIDPEAGNEDKRIATKHDFSKG